MTDQGSLNGLITPTSKGCKGCGICHCHERMVSLFEQHSDGGNCANWCIIPKAADILDGDLRYCCGNHYCTVRASNTFPADFLTGSNLSRQTVKEDMDQGLQPSSHTDKKHSITRLSLEFCVSYDLSNSVLQQNIKPYGDPVRPDDKGTTGGPL